MPRNIEIKAKISSVEALLPRAQQLADGPAVAISQDDTFFAVPQGRLKLREFADRSAELIHYQRGDTTSAKASDYVLVPVPNPAALRLALQRGCGVLGRVQKQRVLVMVGQTRIHLDRVQGLGDFMELEVVLRSDQTDAEGSAIAEALMLALGLADAPRIANAYLDMLVAAQAAKSTTANTPEPARGAA